MPVIARSAIAALFILLDIFILRADVHDYVKDLVASMTAALIEDNAPGFLKAFDKKCHGYDTLAGYIPELLSQGDISSSVEFLKDEGDDTQRTVELDWYLEIRPTAPGPLIQRRQAIQCKLEKQKNKWRIISLSPISFFAPQKFT